MPNRSKCDLFIPKQQFTAEDVGGNRFLGKHLTANFLAIQRWADRLLRECLTRVGYFACDSVGQVNDSSIHTTITLVDLGIGIGGHVSITSGRIKFNTAGTYEITGTCQTGQGGTNSGYLEFLVDKFSGSGVPYGPVLARAEETNGHGTMMVVNWTYVAAVGDELYSAMASNTSDGTVTGYHIFVAVKGPF